MKRKLYSLILVLSLPLAMGAREVAVGDSAVQVRETMGAPRGHLQLGERDVLYFDRGEVELNGGRVTRVGLRSLEEQTSFESKQAASVARADEIRNRVMEEGRALLAGKLSDPVFRATPYSYQVSFWENFSQRYPSVSAAEPLLIARARLAEQAAKVEADRARAEQAQRIADLAERAARADARARNDYVYPFYPVYRDYSSRDHDRGIRSSFEGDRRDRSDDHMQGNGSSFSRAGQNVPSLNGKSMIGPSKLGWDPSINMMDWDTSVPQLGTFRPPRR